MPVHVTVLASTLVIGGAEQLLLDLLRNVNRQRFRIDLLFLRQPGPVGQEIIRLGFPHREDILRSRLDLGAVPRLAGMLRELRTDVLFCINHLNCLFYGVAAARLARTKAVVNWHNETNRRYRFHRLTMLARRLAHLGVDRVVAAAKGHKNYIVAAEGVPGSKVEVIYNGVDTTAMQSPLSPAQARARLGLPETAKTVAIVAGLRPDKAHEIFLDAADITRKSVPDAHFLIVGDGERRQALESQAKRLHLEGCVHFLGFRRDVADILAATDIIALSSYPWQETLSVAMLEAMAVGIPAVVTDVGFLSEVVTHGVNGFLAPPGDAAALAQRFVNLLADPELRTSMGREAARCTQSACSAAAMAAGFERLFEELACGPQHG